MSNATENLLPTLLACFYQRVREDEMIGPLFNDVVTDWPRHLERLTDFWSSVMHTTGRYKGNPMALHLKHADRLDGPMFERWLEIWKQTTNEMLPAEGAAAMQAKAERIAESLQLGLKLSDRAGRAEILKIPTSEPYRSTPVFDTATLPKALRRAHSTKAGTWGVIRVLEGRLRYTIEESGAEIILDAEHPGKVQPQELHHVEPIGEMRMRVDFYDHDPAVAA